MNQNSDNGGDIIKKRENSTRLQIETLTVNPRDHNNKKNCLKNDSRGVYLFSNELKLLPIFNLVGHHNVPSSLFSTDRTPSRCIVRSKMSQRIFAIFWLVHPI